jgi:hypothetical protein
MTKEAKLLVDEVHKSTACPVIIGDSEMKRYICFVVMLAVIVLGRNAVQAVWKDRVRDAVVRQEFLSIGSNLKK